MIAVRDGRGGEVQQLLDLGSQLRFSRAGTLELRRPPRGGQLEQLGQQVVEPGAPGSVGAGHVERPEPV